MVRLHGRPSASGVVAPGPPWCPVTLVSKQVPVCKQDAHPRGQMVPHPLLPGTPALEAFPLPQGETAPGSPRRAPPLTPPTLLLRSLDASGQGQPLGSQRKCQPTRPRAPCDPAPTAPRMSFLTVTTACKCRAAV